VGVEHELHAGVVHDDLVVAELRVLLRDPAAAVEEEPVRELHDVRLSQSSAIPVAERTRTAAAATSGPMPSPGIKVAV
jgi:hypothetical protein